MKKNLFILLAGSTLFLAACGGEETDKKSVETNNNGNNQETLDTNAINAQKEANDKNLIKPELPSPLNVAILFNEYGLSYEPGLTNDVANADMYATKIARALNFGVYSTDLAYCVINEKTDEAKSFLGSIQNLAEEIGVSEAFENADMYNRFEENISNPDALIDILVDVKEQIDISFENNGQRDLEVITFTGAWVEGLYLGSNVASKDSENEFGVAIVEQMNILNTLLTRYEMYDNKTADISDIENKLKELRTAYDNLETIKNLTEEDENFIVPITDEEVKTMTGLIVELRNSFVNV